MVLTKIEQLDIIKFNLEVFKVFDLINKKDYSETVENKLIDYLFWVDENRDFHLNDALIKYSFSKYDVLDIISNYFEENNEIKNLIVFEDDLIKKLDEVYSEMEFPDVNQHNFKNNVNDYKIQDFSIDELAIERLISEIRVDDFAQKEYDGDLISELDELMGLPIFKYMSSGLEDFEVSRLIGRVKSDVQSNMVIGDVGDIVDYYFGKYKLLKNQLSLNHFLNEYIRSPYFIEISKDFDDETIITIINKLRDEIFVDRAMDKNKIALKLKDYFKKELIKQEYFEELDDCKNKIPDLSYRYNLTHEEVEEIFDETAIEINGNKVVGDLSSHLYDKIIHLIESNQSKSRIKLNNVIKSVEIREKIAFDESDLEKVDEQIGELIYDNKIRSYQITEELIIEKLGENAYGIR